MTKRRSAKSAVIMSALSILLCLAMMIGTTYAWFTDSISSTNNVIKSGRLDVELYYQVEGQSDWSKVTEDTNIFKKDALWEPGHTEVVKLKVVNEGDLALKYRLGVNIASETGSVNVYGEEFKLSDYIKYGVVEGDQTYTRDQAVAAVDATALVLNQALAANDVELLPKSSTNTDNEDIVTMVVYMPTTVDNKANYAKGANAPVINLGINLFATQATYEFDSFDDQYDDIAIVSTADELKDAIANGKNVMLGADIAVDANNTIAVNGDTTLDLNGHEIKGTSSATGKNRALFTVKGNMTVFGNGTVSMVHTAANMGWNNLSAPFSVEGGSLTIEEGVAVINLGGTDMAYAVDVNTTLGETELNVNGAVLYSSYIGVRIFNNHSTEKGTVNYNDGIIQGAKNGYDIWAQLMSCPAENAVVNIASDITYTTADLSGTMYYIDADTTIAATATELANAIAAGGDILLAADIDMGSTTLKVTADTAIDLNGNTLSGACNAGQAHLFMVNNGVALDISDTSADQSGKITYAAGSSNVGWIIDAEGAVNLYSGTLELTGDWSIGYAVDVRPNAWGTAYTEGTVFTMYGGKIVSSDGAVRVASSSSDTYTEVSATFIMKGGVIDAAWDGVFIQQSNAAYDILNVQLLGGSLTGGLAAVRFYGPDATSVIGGVAKPMTLVIDGTELNTVEVGTRTWLVDGQICYGGGMSLANLNQYATVTIK